MTSLRRVRAARGGAVVFVTYHRVHDRPSDPEAIRVGTTNFAEHVAAYASRFTPLTAGEVFERMRKGMALPRDGVVVTVDDGYSDCLTTVLPVLERHGVLATIFVSSGFVGSELEMWWDEIERVCFVELDLPAVVTAQVDGIGFAYPLGEGASVEAETAAGLQSWNVTMPAAHPRHSLYLALRDYLHPLSGAQRRDVLEQLRELAGISDGARVHNRGLAEPEVRALTASGLVEIGAHTVTHPSLASLPQAQQRSEILQGVESLSEITGSRPVSFSYPYGTYDSFTEQTAAIVREAGLVGACTTELGRRLPWGSVSVRSERYEVPRTASANVGGDEMAALVAKRLGL